MRFFIVEDNYYTATIMKVAVERMGHSIVAQVHDCKEAINKINLYEFDVLLLDILLPDGWGIDILKKIGKKNIKVIAITAVEQEQIDDELKKMNVDVILRKPFSYDELEKAIKKLYE